MVPPRSTRKGRQDWLTYDNSIRARRAEAIQKRFRYARAETCSFVQVAARSEKKLVGVVDLGALQAIGIIDVERLPLGVEIESGHAGFTVAVAGILDSAEWQMRFGADRGRVHVDDSGFEIALRAEGVVHVAGVDG